MSDAKDVGIHCGGDYGLFTQDGELCENFGSVEGAIENVVAAWHEVSEWQEAFTIRDKVGKTVATVAPVGSDKCIIIRDNGDTMTWTEIHYVLEDERYQYTFAINNGVEYKFKF